MTWPTSIGFIGGGRVTRLLLQRLGEQNALPETVWISDPNIAEKSFAAESSQTHLNISTDNSQPAKAQLVVLAVHPPVIDEVCAQIASQLANDATVLSLVPTVTIKALQEKLQGFTRLVRMIPNAPSIIGKGYNPVAFSQAISEYDKSQLHQLFSHWGAAPEVPEGNLEAYAIITGMGPTYFWFQWLELLRLAGEFGLGQFDALQALISMVRGAVDTLLVSDLPEDQVLDLIPSYPLKKHETTIKEILDTTLISLYQKLSKTKENSNDN